MRERRKTRFGATEARPDAAVGAVLAGFAGGAREPLLPETLRVGRDGLLRATLASGHVARFSRSAQVALGMRLLEDPSAPGGFRLPLGGKDWPLGAE